MSKKPIFVVQKHHATHLHYDLRLEMKGVLKSWAVPKGAPKKIGEKHLAILTQDHALSYAHFEGVLKEGSYGAGKVEIWDEGSYESLKEESLMGCFKKGLIEFKCHGKKLTGCYALVLFKEKNWLWIKIKEKR